MSGGEHEIHGSGGPIDDPGDGPGGPHIERLHGARNQSDGFAAAADRASRFAENRGISAEEIAQAIRNTSGQ